VDEAAAAEAAAEAAVVEDEAALPATTTEAKRPCARSSCAQYAFDFVVLI
jgi:hypothetical protein